MTDKNLLTREVFEAFQEEANELLDAGPPFVWK